jgi:hypothetical protein
MAGMPATDPYSAAFGAAAQLGKAAIDDKTNLTQSTKFDSTFDGSGWSINIGSGSLSATASKNDPVAGVAALLQNPVALIGLAVALYLVWKRRG